MGSAVVRELRRTMEDAQLLAECVNAWNEDDSWPGGFTGGTELTAETVYESWIEKDAVYKQYVLEYNNKIAGYVSLDFSPQGKDIMYVPLLGVAPKYQRKGFGKKLLLKVIEETINLGKLRLDLHTWAGNLRAMPLYKRTGFIWYPDTSVHMMNFIPGILNQEFFVGLIPDNWYEAFLPSITQEPDKMKFEGVEGFIYQFKIEQGILRVLIDAHAQKICGYELIDEHGKLKEKIVAKTSPHRLYKGFFIPRSMILAENMRSEPVELEVLATGKEGILEPLNVEKQCLVSPGGKECIEWEWKPKSQPMVSYEDEPSFRTWSRYDIATKINGKKLSLATGARVLRGLIPKPRPSYFAYSKRKGVSGEIELRNLTDIELNGKVALFLDGKELTSLRDCKIGKYERTKIPYSVPAEMIHERITTLEIKFKQTDTGSIINEEIKIGTPMSNEPVAYVVPFEGYILENSLVKAVGRTYEYPEIEELIVKKTSIRHSSLFFTLVGTPWNYDNSEFYEQPDEVEAIHEENKAIVKLAKTSKKEKPGLKLESEFVLSANSDLLEARFRLGNTGEEIHRVALRTGVFSRVRNPLSKVYYPNLYHPIMTDDQRFYSFSSKDELRQLRQGWISIFTPEGLGRGLVSDESVWTMGDSSTRGFIVLESKEFDIVPKEVLEFPKITFVPIAANPMRMKMLWHEIKAREGLNDVEQRSVDHFDDAISVQVKSDLESDQLPVVSKKEIVIKIQNNTGLQLKDFEIHDGKQWKSISIDPFSSAEVAYFRGYSEGLVKLGVKTRWQAVTREYRIRFYCLPPHGNQSKWERLDESENLSFEFKSEMWSLKSSNLGMTLYSIETAKVQWLNSFFPEIKPFSHLDHFVGGISASIRASNEKKYGEFLLNSPEYKLATIGEWEVIEYFGRIKSPQNLFGLKYMIRYKAHSSLPILLIEAEVTNPFEVPVDVDIPLIMSFNPNLSMLIEEEKRDVSIELNASSSGSMLTLSPETTIRLRSPGQDELSIVPLQKQGKILATTISSDSLLVFYSKEGIIPPGGTSKLFVALVKH